MRREGHKGKRNRKIKEQHTAIEEERKKKEGGSISEARGRVRGGREAA